MINRLLSFFLLLIAVKLPAQTVATKMQLPMEQQIGIIELRNYVIKAGQRDNFIDYFETHFITSQVELHAYPLGQYRVKGQPDNFFWIRGFESMETRSRFLPSFYHGPFWQQHRAAANSMLANNDNVHLLRPLALRGDSLVPVNTVSIAALVPHSGLAVVDLYTANTKLPRLIQFFGSRYLPLLHKYDIMDYSCWVSELTDNDFPALPVFQDSNLLVTITFYSDEAAYEKKTAKVQAAMDEQMKADMQDIVTLKHTLVLYPTAVTLAH